MKTLFSGVAAAILLLIAPSSWAALSFSQTFGVSQLDVGNNTSLTFTIQNTSPTEASWDIAFDSSLPAGLRVSDAQGLDNTCGGSFVVDDVLGSISLSGGRVAASESCLVKLNVTSDTAGLYTSTSGVLRDQNSGDYGNSGDTLTVVENRMSFSLGVSSSTAELGDTISMTYHIQGPGGVYTSIQFSHQFPDGIKPRHGTAPVRSGVCGGASIDLSEDAFTLSGMFVTDTSVCEVTIEMDVVGVGEIELQTSNISYSSGSTGFATNVVSVQPRVLNLQKTVLADSVLPGQPFDVTYRLSNNSRSDTLTNIAFSDDLDATISGLAVVGMPASQACGTGSILGWDAGSGLAALSGGSLAPEESCEFTLTLQAPPAVSEGEYSNAVQASADSSSGVVLSQENATPIPVIPQPLLDISLSESVFSDQVDVTYTLTNTSSEHALNSISFQDAYTFGIASATVKSGSNTCSPGSPFIANVPAAGDVLGFTTSTPLAAGQSCEFTFTITFSPGSKGVFEGALVEEAFGEINGVKRLVKVQRESGRVVNQAPIIQMTPSRTTVTPGEPFDINISVLNGDGYPEDLDGYTDFSDIEFTFNGGGFIDPVSLTQTCPGLSQVGNTFSLPSLGAGEGCTFTQQASAVSAASGRNVMFGLTNISAQVEGISVSGADVDTTIRVSGLMIDTVVEPRAVEVGQPARVTLNLQNVSASEAVTNLSYQVSTRNSTPYAFAVSVNAVDVCGSGSQLNTFPVSTNTTLQLTNISLAPGEQCQIPVDIMIKPSAAPGLYTILQKNLSYVESSNSLVALNTGAILEVLEVGGISDISEQRNLDEPNPDNDPFDTTTEQLAGDLNGDGTADAVQSFIASTISPLTGRPVGLEVDPQCTINSFEMVTAASIGTVQPGVSFPEGMASFSISCAQSTVRLYLPGADFSGNQAIRKYGPQAPDFAGGSSWYELPTSRIDTAAHMIEFVLTDNALGDSNPAVGVISDPIGLADLPPTPSSQRAIPVAGVGWLALLAVQLLLVGGYMRRKRRIQR
ncbi:choice-of-anchor U domain-containing protein [Marinobacterium iners]|uniref:DUF7933 domain-containing protein n=1 Tax=Marinobacterium iners DSM 11526 TaxID=1122198 RepID=A0A1H4BVY7_9GAMM|nr:choice-of-anchor U domain-containing protein [Marinobacterium iners]SEA52254.1 hypothetical protein SAMN02745729_10484 [Marinobacterium iners DSM 11526]